MSAKNLSRSRTERLRDWLAMRLQRRRRRNSAAPHLVIPAPVLSRLGVEWGGTADGWADVVIWVAFETDGLPLGVLEVFVQLDSDWILIGQAYPNDGFRHEYVTQIWGEQYVY